MLFYLFYFIFSPLFYFAIHLLKFFNKKLYLHLKDEKKSIDKVFEKTKNIDRNKKKILLFHAASTGEFEQLKPILSNIDKTKYFIIQTFASPTIYQQRHTSHLFDISCYHPYDVFWKSWNFFSNINPDAYIITRHDIWPIHLFVVDRLKIKTFYINANIHSNSIWKKWFLISFAKAIFNKITFSCVPSENIFQNMKPIMSTKKIAITGDSRFDQIVQRYEKNKNLFFLPDYFKNSKNIIFGSYDENDEKIILESLCQSFPTGNQSLIEKQCRIILVPHENNSKSISQMLEKLKAKKFMPCLFSMLEKNPTPTNIIIINKVGILADIYKHAQLAYVGAGFGRGVHSVIEPAVHGCIIGFGPNIELLDEAKYIHKNNLGHMILNVQDMCRFIDININNPQELNISQKIRQYILDNKNSSKKIINLIMQKL